MIKIEGVTKRFGDFVALNGISFDISDGTVYGLVGINGAGKSTLIRTITGIYIPEDGSVTLDGEAIVNNPKSLSRIAYVPDELYQPSGFNMMDMAKKYALLYPHFNYDRFSELTSAFELDPRKSFGSFSKGMRRQAATILALSLETDYIFFDETFDGLDPFKRAYIKKLIKDDVARRGCTVIVTSHSLRELEDICDQLAILDKGGLIFESDARELVTSGLKVQIAFADEYDMTRFEGFEVVEFSKQGSVANLVLRGNAEEIEAKLREMSPILLETLPLSLEEVFTFELEKYGRTDLLRGLSEGGVKK